MSPKRDSQARKAFVLSAWYIIAAASLGASSKAQISFEQQLSAMEIVREKAVLEEPGLNPINFGHPCSELLSTE